MSVREYRPGGRIPEGRDENVMTKSSEGIASHGGLRATPRRTRPRMTGLATLLLAAGTLAACEGDNLFTGDGPSFQPRILSIGLPDAAFAEDTVRVRIDAAAARQVAQIVVSARGAATRDTVIKIDDAQQQVSEVVLVPIPAVLQDTLLIVEARVTDGIGAVSAPRVSIAPAFGPPVVQSVNAPGAIRPGDVASLSINAFGARRIARLDIAARGAISRDTSIVISPPQSSVTQQVTFQVPTAVNDTTIDLAVTAVDEAGFASSPRQVALPFFMDPPTIELITPPSVQPGSPLNVQVAAYAIRQVAQVRLELRGAVVKDTVINIDPRRVDVLSFVSIGIPGNVTGNEITIRGFAVDRAGAVSATPIQSISVPTSSPVILTVDVPSGAVGGHLVDVRVNATGSRPIREVVFRWRGYLADSLAVPETRVAIDPPRQNVTADVNVRVPCYADSRQLLVLVTAIDEADVSSAVASGTVSVAGNAECVDLDNDDEAGAGTLVISTLDAHTFRDLYVEPDGVLTRRDRSFAIAPTPITRRLRSRRASRRQRT